MTGNWWITLEKNMNIVHCIANFSGNQGTEMDAITRANYTSGYHVSVTLSMIQELVAKSSRRKIQNYWH